MTVLTKLTVVTVLKVGKEVIVGTVVTPCHFDSNNSREIIYFKGNLVNVDSKVF